MACAADQCTALADCGLRLHVSGCTCASLDWAVCQPWQHGPGGLLTGQWRLKAVRGCSLSSHLAAQQQGCQLPMLGSGHTTMCLITCEAPGPARLVRHMVGSLADVLSSKLAQDLSLW